MAGTDDDERIPTLDVENASTRSPPTLPDREPGPPREDASTAIGRYRLGARLGAGAMGVVWSAVDPQLERKVAIKVVHPRLASSPEAARRMLREARAMAKLSHRAVVTVHDAGEVDGRLFLAMELIDGETLTARLRRPDLARPAAWRQRLALVVEAGRGLAAAHAAGVLHRDFKPDNVLVDHTGRVCVGDFGLAALGDVHRERASHAELARASDLDLTMTGALLGTPAYMSPQQLRGEPADARADQFAFCVTAYEALYGARPFTVSERGYDALPALADAIERGALASGPDAGDVPLAVRDVLRRGLAAEPAARWPDMDALLAALDAASGLRARRRRRAAIASAALALAVLAAGGGALIHARSAPPGHAEKHPLFRIPPEAVVAIGPGGGAIVVGFQDLEVHEPGRDRPWTAPLPSSEIRIFGLDLDADEVRYSTEAGGEMQTWKFRAGAPLATSRPAAHAWVCHFGDGDLVADDHGAAIHAVLYMVGDRELHRWPISAGDVHRLVQAPDHQRVAYIDTSAGADHIVVLAPDGSTRHAPSPTDVTAIAWLDRDTLLFARGTQVEPKIYAVHLDGGDGAFGEPHEIYRQDTGWFMRLIARDGRVLVVDGNPIARVRVFGDASAGNRDYEAAMSAAELGWTDAGDLLVWNRATLHVMRAHASDRRVDTGIALATEPANATLAGDVLVATLRSATGRDVEAYDLRTGARLWRTIGELSAVRCTDDRVAPCVAIRAGDHAGDIVDIDPATGALGALRAQAATVTDVALGHAGHLMLALSGPILRELDAHGALVADIETGLATQRSVAYAADGGVVLSGTAAGTTYKLGRVEGGAFRALATTDTELMMLARPSPDGALIAVVGRTFSTELSEIVLP